ncbi:uncharacterized protein DUF1800 [Yoonia maricola]|uniref:Uncharacterized protein DUF1800 n=1 Tax=Yoonia maricola TaxID=420999 RepID=A0A2M8W2N2_9RHOB|nr:DUF1800 family protein [Yoonia maricola]PJI85195.1 uncharacterized protein DUF1800 [Yoonia maricola]
MAKMTYFVASTALAVLLVQLAEPANADSSENAAAGGTESSNDVIEVNSEQSFTYNIERAGNVMIVVAPRDPVNVSVNGTLVLALTDLNSSAGTPIQAVVDLTAGDHIITVESVKPGTDMTDAVLVAFDGGQPVALADIASTTATADVNNLSANVVAAASTATRSISSSDPLVQNSSVDGLQSSSSALAASEMSGSNNRANASTSVFNQNGAGDDTTSRDFRSAILDAIAESSGVPSSETPETPTQPTTPGTFENPAFGPSVSSPLSPPTDVAITQAIQLTSAATDDGLLASTGQTLFGAVQDPMTYDIVTATIAPSGRTTTVDVGAMRGQFAVRLFAEDMTEATTVTLTASNSMNDAVTPATISYNFDVAYPNDGIAMALSRLTYGATPDLYARVRAIGFQAYVEEQLALSGLDETALNRVSGLGRGNSRTEIMRSYRDNNMARATLTTAQLREVMGTFWSNHFHANNKETNIYLPNLDDRDFFRTNAFGNFEDLLLYSAQSPLMSQYLDNDVNTANSPNENYAREILELHTVGVDGGYGDDDVIAMSEIFSGWGWEKVTDVPSAAADTYGFLFRAQNHVQGDKDLPFLNTTISGRSGADGVLEGEEVISILSTDDRTKAFVCGKIVQKFVADDPPAYFIEVCTTAWTQSNGSSREMLRAILLDPAYITTVEYQRAMAKTPIEFAASYLRALGAQPSGNAANHIRNISTVVANAGWDPYYFAAPTGISEVSSAWLNSAPMITLYNGLADIPGDPSRYGHDLPGDIADAGLETAEEVAAYLLTVGTADRFYRDEYEAMVNVLKGEDGIFEPMLSDETDAINRAATLLLVSPSFLAQ